MAAPTTFTRTAGENANWTDTTKWTPSGNYPGSDPGDTAVFDLATGEIVVMNADKTMDSIVVLTTG